MKSSKRILGFLVICFTLFSLSAPLSAQTQEPMFEFKLGQEIFYFSVGGLLCLPGLVQKKNALTSAEISALDRNNVNSFDRGATYNWSTSARHASDALVITSMMTPLVLLAGERPRKEFLGILLLYAESVALVFGVTQFVKTTVDRTRPYMYNPDVPMSTKLEWKADDSRKSFFSSHTAFAFNGAVFLSTVFTMYYPKSTLNFIVWPASLAAASLVGYFRYKAGMHYRSDVLVGAGIGALIGFLVPFLHKKTENTNISILPSTGEFNGLVVRFGI